MSAGFGEFVAQLPKVQGALCISTMDLVDQPEQKFKGLDDQVLSEPTSKHLECY